jgi:hypothetical protein
MAFFARRAPDTQILDFLIDSSASNALIIGTERYLREMKGRVKRTIKFGKGSDVTDSTKMAHCLKQLRAFNFKPLDNEWTRLRALVFKNPSQIFVVDTETGFSGLCGVHQAGIVNYQGTTILSTMVNHGYTVAEYLEQTSQGLGEALPIRTCKAVCKSYGLSSQKPWQVFHQGRSC